jgi:serine phosphatase RsbU (regulator of sigma subunit)
VLVFGFTISGNYLTNRGKSSAKLWLAGAGILAVVILIAGCFTNGFLNILFVPLLVGLAQQRKDWRSIIYSSTAIIILIFIQNLIAWLAGWFKLSFESGGGIATIIAVSSVALSLATLMRKYRTEIDNYIEEQESKASEMEVAHEIQTSLMPPSEIVTGHWSMAARSLPAKDVGGDFYEYIPYVDKGIGGVAIGDVAGKGIPAALQMAVVRTLFRVEARRRIFPGETLISVNMALQAERSFGMVTLLYAFVDPNTSMLHVSNAGHNFPLILNGSLEEVRIPGLPLGIDESAEYDEIAVRIAPGTSVILYTDGVVEAMDSQGEMYGFERLREVILRYKSLEPRAMVDAILNEISHFTEGAPQSDDITVVVVQNQQVPSENDEPQFAKDGSGLLVMATSGKDEDILDGFEEESANWI